jgi:hypothetical protein
MAQQFGYWTPVQDETSARYAVRMSGLPVLVMAVNPSLAALTIAVQPEPNLPLIAALSLLAALLMLLAFRIRSGCAGWLPLVMLLFVLFLGAKALSFTAVLGVADIDPLNGTMLVMGWIIPLICTVLVFGGVRGWRWMVANGVAVRY